MKPPVPTIDELHNIETGAWFSKLSPALQGAILSRAWVRRLADGDALATRGAPAEEWCGVARVEPTRLVLLAREKLMASAAQ